jgi:hypothetical protein
MFPASLLQEQNRARCLFYPDRKILSACQFEKNACDGHRVEHAAVVPNLWF